MTKSTGVGRGNNPASWGNHKSGSSHHRWNDHRIVSSHGYIKVRVGADHPLADPNGYAYEHLLVWVSAGNPRPPKGWVLHHRDEDRQNNRLRNLELLRRSQHNAEHMKRRRRDKLGRMLPKSTGRLLDGVEHNGLPA